MKKYRINELGQIARDGKAGDEYYLAAEVEARIAELEKALREITAFDPGTFRGLEDEIRIHAIATTALMVSESEK